MDVSSKIAKMYSDNRLALLKNAIKKCQKTSTIEKKLKILKKACKYATQSGMLYSSEIENELVGIGKAIKFKTPDNFKPKSNLHIITQFLPAGGHSRVCERWIKFDDSDEIHSVMLVDQRKYPISDFLKDAVKEKNGEIKKVSSLSIEDKIGEIRSFASQFEKVILYINPNDVVSFAAFANKDFTRPVIFFNHLDHLFWIGSAIADMVVNFRSSAIIQSKEYRNVKNNTLLPLPLPKPAKLDLSKKSKIKKELNIPGEAKVVITLASGLKYTPVDGYNFIEDISVLLKKYPDLYFIAIGPSEMDSPWRKLQKDFSFRVNILGAIPNQSLGKYLSIADFALDSYPMPSFTAFLELAANKIPCLTRSTPYGNVDSVASSNSLCNTAEEYFLKIDRVTNGSFDNDLYKQIEDSHFCNSFSARLAIIKESFPSKRENFFKVSSDFKSDISSTGVLDIKIYLKKLFISSKIKWIFVLLKLFLKLRV